MSVFSRNIEEVTQNGVLNDKIMIFAFIAF